MTRWARPRLMFHVQMEDQQRSLGGAAWAQTRPMRPLAYWFSSSSTLDGGTPDSGRSLLQVQSSALGAVPCLFRLMAGRTFEPSLYLGGCSPQSGPASTPHLPYWDMEGQQRFLTQSDRRSCGGP